MPRRHDIPVDGTVDLPPDPRVVTALGRNHQLETAIADLVDNSVDAHAADVLIRFVQDGTSLIGLHVLDNGRGMPPDLIDTAMTVGGRRDYGATDLGHFGLGLKAASFSQADILTVVSRADGRPAVGRLLRRSGTVGFKAGTITADYAAARLDRAWPIPTPTGTLVSWHGVRSFPASSDPAHVQEYVSRTISHLQGHLGLMFHRMITDGRVRITIDVEDTQHGTGVPSTVAALDPFRYPHAPAGWPRTLTAQAGEVTVALHCHIWPERSNVPEYRLPGGAETRQGLYFYRRDRLLQAGGWEGIHASDRRLQLARVSIDIDGDIEGLFILNPEKSRVSAGPQFAALVHHARADDGTTIGEYLQAAEETWTDVNRRVSARRRPVMPPGRGLDPKLARRVRDELPQLGSDPLNIQWRPLADDSFIEVDRDTGTLWLNSIYRTALLGGRRGGLNDLPVLKAALFLLTENVFHGNHLGPRDKDNIELWQDILTAAAQAERATFQARR